MVATLPKVSRMTYKVLGDYFIIEEGSFGTILGLLRDEKGRLD